MKRRTKAFVTLAVCFAVLAAVALGAWLLVRQRQAQLAEQAAHAESVRLAEEVRQEAERRAAEEKAAAEQAAKEAAEAEETAKAELAARQAAAAAAKEAVRQGDCIGTVWVEGTEVNCGLYWGDEGNQFRVGAGCQAGNGCVLPGENGTVFVGGHTDSWFVDLKSAQIGSIIHLDTLWGNFEYRITETKVIYDTQVEECRWGAEAPSCILYTCYPFGIQTPTNQRYLVYADPVQTDENGVVPSGYPEVS